MEVSKIGLKLLDLMRWHVHSFEISYQTNGTAWFEEKNSSFYSHNHLIVHTYFLINFAFGAPSRYIWFVQSHERSYHFRKEYHVYRIACPGYDCIGIQLRGKIFCFPYILFLCCMKIREKARLPLYSHFNLNASFACWQSPVVMSVCTWVSYSVFCPQAIPI